MTRHYVRKTAKGDPATEKAAIEDYYRLKDANKPAPLKNAAFNRVKENTLCTWVKVHATAEAALAAYAERRKQGGQTHSVCHSPAGSRRGRAGDAHLHAVEQRPDADTRPGHRHGHHRGGTARPAVEGAFSAASCQLGFLYKRMAPRQRPSRRPRRRPRPRRPRCPPCAPRSSTTTTSGERGRWRAGAGAAPGGWRDLVRLHFCHLGRSGVDAGAFLQSTVPALFRAVARRAPALHLEPVRIPPVLTHKGAPQRA